MENENINKSQKDLLDKSSSASDNQAKKEELGVSKKVEINEVNSEKDSTSCDLQEVEKENSSISSEKTQKSGSPAKVPNKFIANWKHACDKTKDRTKELLKKWRTLPEVERERISALHQSCSTKVTDQEKCGWSVHVWSTWVNRYPEEVSTSMDCEDSNVHQLTKYQKSKFGHIFNSTLDSDQDGMISVKDAKFFFEKIRHFADWACNSMEFNILQEVQSEFLSSFFAPFQKQDDNVDASFILSSNNKIGLEDWYSKWQSILENATIFADFPLWIQYFSKVLFNTVNRSGSGIITQDELKEFYISVLSLDLYKVNEMSNNAYWSMTSNGDCQLSYPVYKLCFANFMLGKYPNGAGQWIFGPGQHTTRTGQFPIDYSALNADTGELEQYTLQERSYRHSVVV